MHEKSQLHIDLIIYIKDIPGYYMTSVPLKAYTNMNIKDFSTNLKVTYVVLTIIQLNMFKKNHMWVSEPLVFSMEF